MQIVIINIVLQILVVKLQYVASVLNVKYKITERSVVALATIPGTLLLSVKEKQSYVTDFVLAMTAGTVSRFAKVKRIAHVERNASMEVVVLYAPSEISAPNDRYVIKMYACPVVLSMHTVEMIWFVHQDVA